MEEENGIYYVGNWALGIVREKVERTDLDDSISPFVSPYAWKEVLPESGAITIREGTVGICANAFSDSKIQGVSLPNSLKYICPNAFSGCNNLKSISIPQGVEKIGNYAFNACRELESVILREGLIRIGDTAFNCCEKLQSVTIPHTVKFIGSDAFRFCKGLENLVIPDIEIEIGRDAFGYCGDIPNMDVPERILKTIKFSSTDEDETAGYEGEADGYEPEKITETFDDDDLPF